MRTSYQDIKAEIVKRIREDIWPPGAALPGEVELAAEFDCARATVSRAMRELVDEGVLDRRRKAGTRVKTAPLRTARFTIPLIREEIEASGASYRYALVERAVIGAPGWLRAKLKLPQEAEVLHLICMHFGNERPYQFEERWINLAALPEAGDQDFETIGPNEWLVRKIPFSDVEFIFSATNATDEIANYLGVDEGDALFTIERTTWMDGQNITHTRLFHGRGYKLTTRV